MKSKYIETTELEKLRAMLAEEAWLPLWVSLETGLRIGDVVKLRKANLKADGLHYKAQKTGKNGVAKVSAELRKELAKKRGKWLFPSPYKAGKHITRQCAWARIKAACKRAGVAPDGVSPHSLRKVFAVELYREKGFKAVQEALQHNSAATTENNRNLQFRRLEYGRQCRASFEAKGYGASGEDGIEALGENYALKKENKRTKKGS